MEIAVKLTLKKSWFIGEQVVYLGKRWHKSYFYPEICKE